jgi:epoxyqueuosine reductase
LLERDFGRLAGLGWFGKNTMLISRSIGSWFFLGAILTDIELTYDQPLEQTFCGSCTRCLDACPTKAFPEPGVLDARRCISYLTIEHRHAGIPEEFRSDLGPWLFGCDICQDVCPWNRFAPSDTLPEFQQKLNFSTSECRSLLRLTEKEFRDRFAGSPLLRSGRTGLLRNAAIVLANLRDFDSRPELEVLLQDGEEILRETAAWAIQQLDV